MNKVTHLKRCKPSDTWEMGALYAVAAESRTHWRIDKAPTGHPGKYSAKKGSAYWEEVRGVDGVEEEPMEPRYRRPDEPTVTNETNEPKETNMKTIETNVTLIKGTNAANMDMDTFLTVIAAEHQRLQNLEDTGLASTSTVIAAKIKETKETIASLVSTMDNIHGDTDDSEV
jgi:hypothetical protein